MTFRADESRDDHGRWTGSVGGAVAHIVRSLGGLREEDARQSLADGHFVDTRRMHSHVGDDGKDHYTAERSLHHKRIIEHFLSTGQSRPEGSHPDAIFTAGGPASGKSGLAGQAKKDDGSPDHARNLPTPKGHVYVNPDDIKEHLPEYQRLKDAGRGDIAASAVHEESSHIAKALTEAAMAANMPVVIDGVGNSEQGKFARKLKAARKRGYNVTVRYAHVPVNEANSRERARFTKTGRKVPEGQLRKNHRVVSARFHSEIRHMPGVRSEIYSTMGGGKPKMIALRDPKQSRGVNALDRRVYAEFIAKGGTPAAGRNASMMAMGGPPPTNPPRTTSQSRAAVLRDQPKSKPKRRAA